MKYRPIKTVLLLLLSLFVSGLQATATSTASESQAFKKSLSLKGLHFTIDLSGEGSIKALKLTVKGLESGKDVVLKHEIDGSIYRTAVADLDGNGYPEIYLFTASAGSGSYGAVIAYSSNKNRSITPIYMPELDPNLTAAKGYMGHDDFSIVGNRLIRRFPIYEKDDANCCPSSGTRQLSYKLIQGEAGWQLKLDKVTNPKKGGHHD